MPIFNITAYQLAINGLHLLNNMLTNLSRKSNHKKGFTVSNFHKNCVFVII